MSFRNIYFQFQWLIVIIMISESLSHSFRHHTGKNHAFYQVATSSFYFSFISIRGSNGQAAATILQISFFSNKIKYSLLWPLSSLFVLKSIPGFPLYHFLIFLSRFSFSLLIFFSTKCSYFSCVLNP